MADGSSFARSGDMAAYPSTFANPPYPPGNLSSASYPSAPSNAPYPPGPHHPGYPPSHSPSPPPPFKSHEGSPPRVMDGDANDAASVRSGKSARFKDKTFNTAFGPISVKALAQKKYIKWYIIIILISIGAALLTIFHKQIVTGLQPFANDLQKMKYGWLIPVGILFVISFPPLFGHEIITVLCGLVWGLWAGFGIVALGTFLGELGNFFVFKYACTARSNKLESTDLNYACMCVIVREGGFWIAFLARLSAIPGHLVTPVFATTGMNLFVFCAATLLSMPKQLAAVYVGTLFETDKQNEPTSSKVVEYVVLSVAVVITFVAMWYIYRKMGKKRPEVERMWAEKRQARLAEEGLALPNILDRPGGGRPGGSNDVVYDPPVNGAKGRHYGAGGTFGRHHEEEKDGEGPHAGLVGHAAAPGYAGLDGSSSSTVDLPHQGGIAYEDPYDLSASRRGRQLYDQPGPSDVEVVAGGRGEGLGRQPTTIEFAPPTRPERGPPQAYLAQATPPRSNTALPAPGSAAAVPTIPPPPSSPSFRRQGSVEDVSTPRQPQARADEDGDAEFYRRKSKSPRPPDVVAAARARSGTASTSEGPRPPQFASVDPGV